MRRLITRRQRWRESFHTLGVGDRILIYAGTAAAHGAIWHTHHGDRHPHLHVQLEPDSHHHGADAQGHHDHSNHSHVSHKDHQHAQNEPHTHDHHPVKSFQQGHWHRVVPAVRVHLPQLLVVALGDVWFAISDAAISVITRKSTVSARAPPSPSYSA